jgi:hypothetical protein
MNSFGLHYSSLNNFSKRMDICKSTYNGKFMFCAVLPERKPEHSNKGEPKTRHDEVRCPTDPHDVSIVERNVSYETAFVKWVGASSIQLAAALQCAMTD